MNWNTREREERDREGACAAVADQPRQSSSSVPGATSSSTSTERCDSGPSDSVDVMEEEFNIFFRQQQQNGRTIPRGQDENARQQSDSEPSASYASVLGNNYCIFLSFRGPDTRTGFSDHLYHRLVDVGLHRPDFVFRDDEELRFGQPIGDNLLDAIERSKISIPVISETYAASEWCLREIMKIMDCVERGQQKVYPVLYKVEPKDVRHMLGKFGDAFRRQQHRFAEEVQRKGPEALKKAVERRIYESEKVASGHEGKFVKELVETIRCEQQHELPPSLPEDLVGIDDHVTRVMNLADTASSEARIIVIYGIGGIGKTTLATIVYKELFDKFECHSHLNDIRETIKSKGMDHVQSLLISDITKSSERTVRDSGIEMIRRSCDKKKVLILLDDVASRDHLDNLIGGCDFELGSRIIITCRDRALLKPEYIEYELKEMNMEDALLLFRKYAFEGEQPPRELTALSSKIVDTTGRIPLALVIIGSFLKRKEKSIWTETLEKLKKVPHKDVQQKLKISFDSLGYEEQQMFLDIACFFIGIDKRIVAYLWKDLHYRLDFGFERMMELSLMKVDDNNELRMHDHLRDLGRVITCPVDKKLWDCSRLWDEEAITVQRSKEENRNIEALSLDEKGSSMFMKRSSFKRMPYLKFLRLSIVKFVGNFEDSLSELRWLVWEKCPGSFTATNVHLEKLLLLDLSGGFISEKWRGWNSIKMEKLKVLNLSQCSHLKSTPNLSAFEKLERLILENCTNLEEIHDSIGDVKCLVSLSVRDCQKLKRLPAPELGELENLEELIIDRTGIEEFPDCLGSLRKLKMLSAVGCYQLTRLPNSIIGLVNLLTLNLGYCSKLRNLPESIGYLNLQILRTSTNLEDIHDSIGDVKCLVSLSVRVRDCQKLKRLPAPELGELENLEELIIDRTGIEEFPDCLGSLRNLKMLSAVGCYQLTRLPNSIIGLVNLSTLNLGYCSKLRNLPESIGYLNLQILRIHECVNLTTLPSTIRKLGKLEELDASRCKRLEGEIHIDGMSSLRILQLCHTSISSFSDAIDKLSRLEKLDLSGCGRLRSLLRSIGKLPSLQHLDLTYCKKLPLLPELPASLMVLKVTCEHRTLPPLSHLIHLKELIVTGCPSLESMPELPSGLLKLCVSTCSKLEKLPSLSSLGSLSKLSLEWCSELTKIEGLEALKSLEELDVSGCLKLSNLDGLEYLESLRCLTIGFHESDAPLWNDDLSLVRLKNLEVLRIRRWQSLRSLDLSQSTTHLKHLSTRGCSNLVEIKGLLSLTNLESWDHYGCTSLDMPERSCFPKIADWKYRRWR